MPSKSRDPNPSFDTRHTHEAIHIAAILNRNPDLFYDAHDPDQDEVCKCGDVAQFWYVTALNSNGDFIDSLQSHKCKACGFEKWHCEYLA